ncbi:1-deoxy-D-xylulose-5-phosphate synthase N-terminal domain-containing protein [Spiroplasma culicicola]|uniref:1-deoxy-D-xylulose-5-phosphate synthase n=1 Tax=Spiroplasma culicicola AES-1 TaxID=1276246 RepID=W6A7F0_9MOLU|nr:1-deoxy-D-xylulose-5-phosphate synthase N-terminal domain-containing protein [Spiroplasma culicicola]AHI52911.1 1-deoxy-D-xylulose-5-phosphate synthase [Spiroplasma culicicola AES-1]
MRLENIENFKDIYGKKNTKHLGELCESIRETLINHTNENGGHIGSSLGVIELTVALLAHYNLDDSIILFDTGHQSHVYKLLTNRKNTFKTLGQYCGISNFQEMKESEFDWISNGHSGTALAYAYAYSKAKTKKNIISVLGDASFYGSYSHAGLINLSNLDHKNIIILNDNDQAIGENAIRINDIEKYCQSLNIDYLVCEQGNDIKSLLKILHKADEIENHVLIHVKTVKANKYNGTKPLSFLHTTQDDLTDTYTQLVSEQIEKIFDENSYLISPAMLNTSSFSNLKEKYPDQVIDCGINEELCALIAAGLAKAGKKVYVSVYATFFQRMFDQLVHDIVRNKLPIVFLIDRAGINYKGGVSHHGIYDVSLALNFKDHLLFHPFTKNDVQNIGYLIKQNQGELMFIRYEKEKVYDFGEYISFDSGKWYELIYNSEYKKTIIAYGSVLGELYNHIKENNLEINLINARFLNPIDHDLLVKHINNQMYIYEQVIDRNNLFANIRSYLTNKTDIYPIAIKSRNVEQGQKSNLLSSLGLDVSKILQYIAKK